MAVGMDYYDGFRTFSWLAKIIGLPIDQVNFLITQFTALILAGVLRSSLSYKVVSPATRHAFGLTIGLALGYFCFGRQAVHLLVLPTLCYIVMRTQNPRYMQKAVLAVALLYLSITHLYRQLYDYGSYTLDITGPLMVITQKVTSLAYSLHDGLIRSKEELTPIQRQEAIYKMPTTMEYFSYVFHFQALMAGPVIYYRDYMNFIHGQHIKSTKSLADHYDENAEQVEEVVSEPSPSKVVVKKVIASLACAALFVYFIPSFSIQRIKDEDFLKNTSIFYKIWYIYVATLMVRFKYYHAWIFAEAICNNSGLGFNGYNKNNEPLWDKFANVDVLKFEVSLNMRESIAYWNMGTNRWLRSMVYDRVKKQKMIFTYALSALWHGFYPGYYLTFANGAFFTLAARSIRRHVRPYFLRSRNLMLFYDLLTFLTTRIVMAYITFSFVLLEFLPSIRLYLYMYLLPHLLGLAAIIFVRYIPRLPEPKTFEKESPESQNVRNGNAHKTM